MWARDDPTLQLIPQLSIIQSLVAASGYASQRLRAIWITISEKEVMIRSFFVKDIIYKHGAVLNQTYADISSNMKSSQLVCKPTKDVLCSYMSISIGIAMKIQFWRITERLCLISEMLTRTKLLEMTEDRYMATMSWVLIKTLHPLLSSIASIKWNLMTQYSRHWLLSSRLKWRCRNRFANNGIVKSRKHQPDMRSILMSVSPSSQKINRKGTVLKVQTLRLLQCLQI